MRTDTIRTTTVVLIVALAMSAAVILLNTGAIPSSAAAAECGGGGGGGGGGTPTPTASPSSTGGGGGLPTGILTNLPGGGNSSSPASSGTPTSSPTSGGTAVKCPSKITIKYDKPAFVGKVTSDSNTCIKGRNVVVKYEKAGKDKTVGTAVTNSKGAWKVPLRKAKGKYYAKTPARRIVKSDGTEINCGAAKSNTIKV